MSFTKHINARDYIEYTKLGDFSVSADGRWLAFVADVSGENELWLMDTCLGDPTPQRLTARNERIVDVSLSPDGEMISFCSDTEGNEVYSIYAVSRDGQKLKQLFSDERWSYFAPQLLPGDIFMYSSDKIKQSSIASYIRYGLSGPEKEICIEGFNTFVSDISTGHNRLVLYCLENNTSLKIFHFDIDSGETTLVSGSSRQPYSCLGGSFISGGQTILFGSTMGADRFQFYPYDLHSGTRKPYLNFSEDIFSGIDWLVHQGYAEKSRLVIGGNSYGGYLALLMAGLHPDDSAATIDFFGPSDLISFINTAPGHLKCTYYKTIGHPEKDRPRLEAISPINSASNITKPVMIVQGANDARVVRAESDRMVAHLKQNNVPVEYLIFGDEGHEFTKLSNKLMILEKMATLIDRVLD